MVKSDGKTLNRVAASVLLLLAFATSVKADLANPSTLVIKETSPARFTVELTLPLVNGRIVKARPILPDICVADGEPEVRGDARKAIRTWAMTCDPAQLVGAPVGIHGLLGTVLDVLLTVETLDGRRHVQQLRATQAFFVIPPPPSLAELASGAGRRGVERLLQRPEMALVLLVSLLIGIRRRALLFALVAFAVAQGLGQWLAGQRWMVMSLFLPQVAAAATAWLIGVELMGRPVLRPGWWRPLSVPMLVLGVLYGAAQPDTLPTMGLSTGDWHSRASRMAGGSGGPFSWRTCPLCWRAVSSSTAPACRCSAAGSTRPCRWSHSSPLLRSASGVAATTAALVSLWRSLQAPPVPPGWA
jgi:hypothetical protein